MKPALEIKAKLPFDYLHLQGMSKEEGKEEINKLVALELYREGKLPFGKCAELIGVNKWQLLEIFKQHKVEMNYDVEEFEEDLKPSAKK